MNGHSTALQRWLVAGVVAGVGLGGVVGLPSAHGASRQARALARASGGAPPRPGGVARARASIVDGAPAQITEFPFQVALYDPRLGSPAKGFFCGGVIIGASRVATAAHCLIGEHGQHSPPAEIAVLAGSSALEPTDPGSVRDPVASTIVDPGYNASSSDYDVGILRLARPLWSGPAPPLDGHSAIAPLAPDVPLADERFTAALSGLAQSATQAVVSGWGDLNAEPGPSPSYPLRLHSARVPLVSGGLCEEAYATIEQPITPRMLCAGSRTDSCYGDSGGPLIAPGAGPPAGDALLGLVDFGNGCGQVGYPGVYVRIADPAVATFLGAGAARSSAVHAQRGLCVRRAGRGRRGGEHLRNGARRAGARARARRGRSRRCRR